MPRIVQASDIPSSLWDHKKNALNLPPLLVDAWTKLLKENELYEKAKTPAPEGFTGGEDKEATDNHLAWRFTGSCARTELSILDPEGKLSAIANTYYKLFAGGNLFISDIPCGAGAASITLLTVIAELRSNEKVPSLPLNVTILGGEISTYARSYFDSIYKSLHQWFEDNAIHVKYSSVEWDVCNLMSNTELIKQSTLAGQYSENKLLVIANFSDYLEKNGKFTKAKPHLDELLRHSCDESSVGIWIEPGDTKPVRNLFSKFYNFVLENIRTALNREQPLSEEPLSITAKTNHPLGNGTFRTNLSIVQFELPERLK